MPEAGNLKEAARPRPPAPKTLVPVSGSAGALRHCAAFTLALLGCLSCLAAEQRFFQQFLSFTASNPETWEVLSPLLVDTNNRGFKLTSILTNLAKLKTTASVAGVRPGMTMDEVVSQVGETAGNLGQRLQGPPVLLQGSHRLFRFHGQRREIHFHGGPPRPRAVLVADPKNRAVPARPRRTKLP